MAVRPRIECEVIYRSPASLPWFLGPDTWVSVGQALFDESLEVEIGFRGFYFVMIEKEARWV